MMYGKFAAGVLVCLGLALPMAAGGDGNTVSASASVRITLYIAPRAEVRATEKPGVGQLCLAHIPAHRHHLLVQDIGDDTAAAKRLSGQGGNYCVAVAASAQGKMVLIVAE